MRSHIEAALVAGATQDQITEVIIQTQFYASGAAVNSALGVAANVFDFGQDGRDQSGS